MIPNINIDAIMSDPLLLIAVALLILGPLVFLVALVQLLRGGKKPEPLPHLDEEPAPEIVPPPYMQEIKEEEPAPGPVATPSGGPEKERAPLPTISGEVQGQVEIIFSQIKTLSKKVAQLESEMESVSRTASAKLEANELKEVPMNPADFTQKLLKLAEHVIVLEKDVARMKSSAKSATTPAADETVVMQQPSASTGQRPPIMPI